MANKNKKMTLANLKSQENKYYSQREVIIDEYSFIIDKHFKPTKLYKLIEEFLEKNNYAEENNIQINMILLLYILTIKHFTNIQIGDTLESQLDALETLTNLNYLERILNEFDQEEFNKVMQTYKQSIDNAKVVSEQLRLQAQQVNEQLEREQLEKEQSKQHPQEVTVNV